MNDIHDTYDEIEKFDALKPQLIRIWEELHTDPGYEHTSLIVPSLSVNQEELSKVLGSSHYEERLLFALIRLKNPNARLIYVTSQPIHPDIVDYYLQLLDGVTLNQARQRLLMISVCDASHRPLSEKILERPRFLARLINRIGDSKRAYLTCYNVTFLERQLAVALGIPLNGVDPELLYYGTKSGSREVFAQTGVSHPAGYENLRSEEEVVTALTKLVKERPSISRAVVKLNEGFAGEGNGIFAYPAERDEMSIRKALSELKWSSGQETLGSFMTKFAEMGGIVEEMVDAEEVRSPSVQMRIYPEGTSALVSSHEQVLGGPTGQAYLGCRFPADEAYRLVLQEEAQKIGTLLSQKGVIGRFGIDFLVTRASGGQWAHHAIEINLRMGGTTPPFHALEFLTGGHLDPVSGLFHSPDGKRKFYSATDNLKSAAYRGLLPEDLFQIITLQGLGYRHATGTGVLFYMIGALSQYGKLGMTCIGNSANEARALFKKTVALLDSQTKSESHGVTAPIFDRYLKME